MSGVARWGDLAPRLISAAVMIVIGVIELWLGGIFFAVGVWLLGGAMVWELSRMITPAARRTALALGALSFAALAVTWIAPGIMVLPLLLATALAGAGRMPNRQVTFGLFAAATLVACYAMVSLRDGAGLLWVLWVIAVVVASDVAGYFAGRSLGGPKFWPAISPKKTWSGTIAGWAAAACTGLAFAGVLDAGAGLAVVSALVALAGQMGDIWESWIKRGLGVKDSSNLIPGHGGVLDRFDAMLGGALLAGLLWAFGLLPGLA